jgi:hypothetical protein
VEELDVMSTNTDGTLTEDQEMLLNAFVDGEATSVERARAAVLVKNSETARQFVDSIRAVSRDVSASFETEDAQQPAELWQRVNARLEQEARAALFHGARHPEEITGAADIRPKRGWLGAISEWFDPRVFVGGISGATVTAALLLLVGNSADLIRPSSEIVTVKVPSAGPAAQPVTAVRAAGMGLMPSMRPVGNSNEIGRRGVEVEWARANGSMRFIQNPGARSATIWVKRRSAASTTTGVPPSRSTGARPTSATLNAESNRGE